jgi:hypothetical protein
MVSRIVIRFDPKIGEMKATVYVPEEQYGLAIGDKQRRNSQTCSD